MQDIIELLAEIDIIELLAEISAILLDRGGTSTIYFWLFKIYYLKVFANGL